MILHRISSREHVRDLSGTGAKLFGGRWNLQGTKMLYTSGTLSLAALEIMVNISSSRQFIKNLYCVEIHFPDQLRVESLKKLPDQWNTFPHIGSTAQTGSNLFNQGILCLKVPSAIIDKEFNYLLNPIHSDFHQIQIKDIRPFILDTRLLHVP